MNLSLMYLLAPTGAAAAGQSLNFIQRLFSPQLLQAWGAPTGHMFEKGYPFASRVVNLGYKVSEPGRVVAILFTGAVYVGCIDKRLVHIDYSLLTLL